MKKYLLLFPLAFTLLAASPNSGTVKTHDSEVGNQNQPRVCGFHVHGFDMTGGTWTITSWPPTGDKTVVASGSGPVSGEISLSNGHYRLDYENPNKHKMLWVECEPVVAPPPPVVTDTATVVQSAVVVVDKRIPLPETDTAKVSLSLIPLVVLVSLIGFLFSALHGARR